MAGPERAIINVDMTTRQRTWFMSLLPAFTLVIVSNHDTPPAYSQSVEQRDAS
jgi:hypothetical protein